MTALKISAMPWTRLTRPEITLVDAEDRFCFRPMMYELATGEADAWEVAPRFETLLSGTGIDFRHGAVAGLDLTAPAVCLDGSGDLGFDRAVIGLGCRARLGGVKGEENAVALHGFHDAQKVKDRVAKLIEERTAGRAVNVVVVGGGHSGVETASCLAEMLGSLGSVLVVERGDRVLGSGTDFTRVAGERALVARGVGIEYRVDVAEITAGSIALKSNRDGEEWSLPADLVIWAAGVQPSEGIAKLGLPVDDGGRIEVDGLLQVKGHEDLLYALGDGAGMTKSSANGGYAGTAQVAVQQAEYAAWNTWASLTGRPKLLYRYTHLGEMMVLGRRDASVATSVGVDVDGAAAWAMRRAAYLARMPTDTHRAKLAVKWAVSPAVAEAKAQAKNATSSD